MSAFLGPIHYWLYNKIEFQDNLVENVISYSESFGQGEGIRSELSKKYSELEKQPLEEIIDETNIHGWLQEKVSIVEYRLADVVSGILARDAGRFEDLEKIFFEYGKEYSAAGKDSAVMIYRFVTDNLLDGMPCDRANQLVTEDDELAVWVRNTCVHKAYWDTANGDISIYYSLRDALIKGMLYGSGFEYERTDENTNQIKRGV
ncbi:MAG: hypothetical protein WBH44_09525 [Proteocatella sp.]